jgi:hypothetical protein
MDEYVSACVEAFQTAWTVVGGTSSPKVSNDDWKRSVAILCAPPSKPPEHFWEQWPKAPTTFELYFRAGYSALWVAVGFTESISGCIRIASVEALQRFWRDALESDEDAINRWRKACEVRIADVIIEMSPPRSFQAMDLLRRKIEQEVAIYCSGGLDESLDPNSRTILQTMLELGCNELERMPARQIIKAALYSGDEKRAFDQLKRLALVAAEGGRYGGYWLTAKGVNIAQRFNGATVTPTDQTV